MFAPIEYDFTHKGYYYTKVFEPSMQNYLSEKNLRVLLSAKVLLSHYKNTPIYGEACSVLDLLSTSAMNGKNTALLNRIAVAPTVGESKPSNEDYGHINLYLMTVFAICSVLMSYGMPNGFFL